MNYHLKLLTIHDTKMHLISHELGLIWSRYQKELCFGGNCKMYNCYIICHVIINPKTFDSVFNLPSSCLHKRSRANTIIALLVLAMLVVIGLIPLQYIICIHDVIYITHEYKMECIKYH